jgi:hypothetical protein
LDEHGGMTRVQWTIVVGVGVAACWARWNLRESDRIQEALIRDMLPGENDEVKIYCLSVDQKDPSDAFMHRLIDTGKHLVKASQCAPGDRGMQETASGEDAILLGVYTTRSTWIDRAESEVITYRAGFAQSSGTVYVEKRRGHWKVAKFDLRWIS